MRLRAGFVCDYPDLYPALKAVQFLQFIGSFYDEWQKKRTYDLLDEFRVRPDSPIGSMSKSDRIKLLIISAIGHRPSLLILDEPTTDIDLRARLELLHFLRKLAREENTSIVVSSRIGDDLDQVAESILTLKKGRVIE